MRRLKHALAGLVALGLIVFILAPDLGEVGQIRTLDENDVRLPTRVWFVEDGPRIILRAGSGAEWVARLRANPRCDFVRPGQRDDYRATLLDDARTVERWNARFLEKYGWREHMLRARRALIGGDSFVIVRLSYAAPPRVTR